MTYRRCRGFLSHGSCVVDTLVSLRERNRFRRGLAQLDGFRQIGIDYERVMHVTPVHRSTAGKLMSLHCR